ncbi:hypothetical protein [Burkholderia metallica]
MADASLDALHAHDARDDRAVTTAVTAIASRIDFCAIHVPMNAAAKAPAAPHSRTLSSRFRARWRGGSAVSRGICAACVARIEFQRGRDDANSPPSVRASPHDNSTIDGFRP